MFDTADRLRELENTVGTPSQQRQFYNPDTFHERLDKLEASINRLQGAYERAQDWCKKIEGHIGVKEIMTNKQQYEFLATTRTKLRGYIDTEDERG